MKVKVCGMKYPDNISALCQLPIDLMGMIFYEKSPRYVETLNLSELKIPSTNIERVGVFVNADLSYILDKVNQYELKLVQLHGNESPEFCGEVNERLPVIKAFSISCEEDIQRVHAYKDCITYALFDTKTPSYGGSGQKFDWSILSTYSSSIPFLLSGGIALDDASAIKAITHPAFYGIDLNSRFEIKPGMKDITLLSQFIKEIK